MIMMCEANEDDLLSLNGPEEDMVANMHRPTSLETICLRSTYCQGIEHYVLNLPAYAREKGWVLFLQLPEFLFNIRGNHEDPSGRVRRLIVQSTPPITESASAPSGTPPSRAVLALIINS